MRAPLTFAAAVLFGAAMAAAPADASCKRFGFTVNDYGKDGPTKDAKELLDKHIAEWAAEQKIKDYKTGAKSVNCELFLNFVVFDEHTCTASANVCWNDGKGSSTPDATSDEAEAGIPPMPIRKASLAGHDKKTAVAAKTPPTATETTPASPPTDTAAATPPEAPPAATEPIIPPPPPATQSAKAADVPPPPSPPPVVETGTLPKDPLTALKMHAIADPAPIPAKSAEVVPDVAPIAPPATAAKRDPAAATAAATAAAAAAERAAVAAETAAAAAKEAAAAAVAASAASKGSVVPPLDAGP
jgi:hypothetical protein